MVTERTQAHGGATGPIWLPEPVHLAVSALHTSTVQDLSLYIVRDIRVRAQPKNLVRAEKINRQIYGAPAEAERGHGPATLHIKHLRGIHMQDCRISFCFICKTGSCGGGHAPAWARSCARCS